MGGSLDERDLLTEEGSGGSASEGDGKRRRKRLALVAVLLLLLLLCVLVSIVSVWTETGPQQRRFIERNAECLKCHTEMIDNMTQASVHSPFLIKDCVTCHTPHGKERTVITLSGRSVTWRKTKSYFRWLPFRLVLNVYDSVAGAIRSLGGGKELGRRAERIKGAKSVLQAPETELCWTCHGGMGPLRQAAHTHAPFRRGYCTNCHDPHSSDFRVLLKQDERDLCITCHPMGPELAKAQVHPPVAGRYCTNCHDPHATEYRGILVDNQRDLCFRCHPSVAPLSLKPVQHQPFLYDSCTGCHEPHGSDYRPLLVKDQPPLCFDCHPGIRQDFRKPSHHPVEAANLDCAACHDPHGADYAALLDARGNEFCYECHAQQRGDQMAIKATYERSKHEAVLCIRCHTPHGSYDAPLLRDSNPDVCLECHSDYEGRNRHPVRPTYYDVQERGGLTCTSSCHRPHGTPYANMLQYPYGSNGWGKDGICLQCHTEVGKKF